MLLITRNNTQINVNLTQWMQAIKYFTEKSFAANGFSANVVGH
jgi:hypothetical protein